MVVRRHLAVRHMEAQNIDPPGANGQPNRRILTAGEGMSMSLDFLVAEGTGSADGAARQAREEMAMPYTPGDLVDGWEFKIIRSHLGLFAKREFRERILAEEERAGWVLIEKFDDHQMRLKRLRKLHPAPEVDDFDPYRIVVDGPERARQARSEGALTLLAIVFVPPIIAVVVAVFRG